MLKTREGKIAPKVLSSLIYIQSLLDGDEEITVSIKAGKIQVVTNEEELITPIVLDASYKVNPIKDLVDHINDEMCGDCLTQDWLYKHTYFTSLVKSYVDSIVHEFGVDVPIPYELARAIIKHEVSDYTIEATKGDLIAWPPSESSLDSMKHDGWLFRLNAKP